MDPRRNSAFTNSIGSIPSSSTSTSTPSSSSSSSPSRARSFALNREGITAANSRSSFLSSSSSTSSSMRHGAGNDTNTNANNFGKKQLERLQIKISRRGLGSNFSAPTPSPSLLPPPPSSSSSIRPPIRTPPTPSIPPEWQILTPSASGTITSSPPQLTLTSNSSKSKFLAIKPIPKTHQTIHSAVRLQVKQVKHGNCDGGVNVVFGCVSISEYYCLSLDIVNANLNSNAGTRKSTFSIIGVTPLSVKQICKSSDELNMLKLNVFVDVIIVVKDGEVSVFVNEACIFDGVALNNDDTVASVNDGGDYGMMLNGTKCVVKDFEVSYFDSEGALHSSSSSLSASQIPTSSTNIYSHSHSDTPVEIEYPNMPTTDRKYISTILDDIISPSSTKGGVTFKTIVGHNIAKRLLQEAIVLPLIVPMLFVGIREPWKGVLLFGPPGTGKTLLARAVAGQNSSTFFNCSTATLISKYRGESEKILRCMFYLARFHSPSVIFLDEVDALVGGRGAVGEHEASRRFKTELFSCIDGNSSTNVMVLAATNSPWDLDEAMRRRLEKRIYIGLPDEKTRALMFGKHMVEMMRVDKRAKSVTLQLAKMTEGYSGADVRLVCKEANMVKMRFMIEGKTPEEIHKMRQVGGEMEFGVEVGVVDFVEAINKTKKSVGANQIAAYEVWKKRFGSK